MRKKRRNELLLFDVSKAHFLQVVEWTGMPLMASYRKFSHHQRHGSESSVDIVKPSRISVFVFKSILPEVTYKGPFYSSQAQYYATQCRGTCYAFPFKGNCSEGINAKP